MDLALLTSKPTCRTFLFVDIHEIFLTRFFPLGEESSGLILFSENTTCLP